MAFTRLGGIYGFDLRFSESEWGRILDFLRLVIDPAPFPASAPLLFLQVLGGGTLKAQIAEILEFRGVSPAALQMLVGKLSSAQTLPFR